ncbi:hypothetical protein [Dehalobacter sp. 14DCB1]|uniref:hypothetical protein n=1 Tax=Dehalobacter sp. 14DCB1 TaxID=2070227 RepID=UPI00104B65FE|nr:hypothetical protein [Dehalobacter sp. 14DCB1]TCX53815.1 hypothetical protein C1I36_03535 [Dehalobacter sp. 14DCB1]
MKYKPEDYIDSRFYSGYSDTDDIRFCPFCGAEMGAWRVDGTGLCLDCNKRFAVIETDNEPKE